MLEAASVSGLDKGQAALLGPKAGELAFLVRARAVDFEGRCRGPYKDDEIDGQAIRIAVEGGSSGNPRTAS